MVGPSTISLFFESDWCESLINWVRNSAKEKVNNVTHFNIYVWCVYMRYNCSATLHRLSKIWLLDYHSCCLATCLPLQKIKMQKKRIKEIPIYTYLPCHIRHVNKQKRSKIQNIALNGIDKPNIFDGMVDRAHFNHLWVSNVSSSFMFSFVNFKDKKKNPYDLLHLVLNGHTLLYVHEKQAHSLSPEKKKNKNTNRCDCIWNAQGYAQFIVIVHWSMITIIIRSFDRLQHND